VSRNQQVGVLGGLLRALFALLALLILAILVVTLLRAPLDLSRYKPMAEDALSGILGRAVNIEGQVVVTTSLWPYFEIEGLHIANPPQFPEGDFALMERARISVGLLPLLQRRLEIREFHVSGLNLDLVRTADGAANWVFEQAAPEVEAAPDPNGEPARNQRVRTDILSVKALELENIHISFRDQGEEPLVFAMESARGSAPLGEPMELSMLGILLEEPFTLKVKADSLGDFLAMTRSRLGMRLDIAKTRFEFLGLSEALRGGRGTELKLSVAGSDLSSLNDLLSLDLPPLQDYYLKADLRSEPDRLELKSMDTGVGESSLQGSMLIDMAAAVPFAILDLSSERIQLTDFDTGDWTAQDETAAVSAAEEPAESSAEKGDDSPTEHQELLSQEALARANASLSIKVAELLSGEDRLGNAELKISLQDGRIQIDPLHLQLSQASLQLQASLKPGRRASDATLRLRIDNFDFGVLTRISNPQSEAGGTVNVDVDVSASASNMRSILSGANGYLDVSAKLENMSSSLVDLWAVNLLSSVVSSAIKDDQEPQINCAISRFRLENGLMTAEQLAVDTSRIRICGEGVISFVDDSFDLVVKPNAKRPEFFSLATPLAVRGKFDDFRIGMKTGVLSLGTTATKFAISPITTPFKRLFKEDLPEDGADICSLPIGPREQELEPLPGC
jgi:uncharacterized protein involved in outer membrane biogenesis